MALPTPHLEKLNSTLANDKLPPEDKPRIEAAIVRYTKWIADLNAVTGTPHPAPEKPAAAAGVSTVPPPPKPAAPAAKPAPPKKPARRGFLFEHNEDLYYATFDGQTAVRLTSQPGQEQWPAISPDGKHVATSATTTCTRSTSPPRPSAG